MDGQTTLGDMRKRTLLRLAAGTVAVGGATLAYASLVERNMFTLRRYDVPVLATDAEPLRILHLSDLHMTPGQRRKQEWVASLAATDPDLVVVTGDNLAHPEAVPGAVRALQPLLDFPGAFVFGSNDYRGPVWKNPFSYLLPEREYVQGVDLPFEDLREVLVGAGWADLNNARTSVKTGGRMIEMVGVDDPHIGRDDYQSVAGPVPAEADLSIALTHSPEPRVLDEMATDGFDLLLAGHTHGGQVALPGLGPLLLPPLGQRYVRGWHATPAGPLYVSRGLGAVPPFIRLNAPPEVTLLTLARREDT
jgi:predicted MPP superfamily phosphohydrolase